MSVLLAKRGPLPAVAIAAAFAAATPPAEAGAMVPEIGSTTVSEGVAALLAQARAAGARSALAVLDWVASANIDWQTTPIAAGGIEGHLAAHLDHMRSGLDRLQNWAAGASKNLARLAGMTYREAAAVIRTARLAQAAEPDDAYFQIADAARAVADGMEALSEGAEMRLRPMQRTLAAFTLKANTMVAAAPGAVRAQGPAFAQAVTQPFFDIYGAVLNAEMSVRQSLDWQALGAMLAKAEMLAVQIAAASQQAPVSLHVELIDGLSAAADGVAHLRTMIEGNAQIMAVAKAEFLRVLNDTTKLTLSDLPKRDARRVLKIRPPIEKASGEPGALRPFGRRIDFDGLAHRWVAGEAL